MTPERWAKIEELFHRAAVCEPESRIALLDRTCSDDPELRREVEALLVCEGSASSYLRAAMRSEVDSFAFSLAGSTVSHYRILDGLGGGGMGVVYRAEDKRAVFMLPVVVRVPLPPLAAKGMDGGAQQSDEEQGRNETSESSF